MYYDKLLNAQDFLELDEKVESLLKYETKFRHVDGEKKYLTMSAFAWERFDYMIERHIIRLSEVENVADVGMKVFPLRGYPANFGAAVRLFYEHRVLGKNWPHQGSGE